MLRTTIIPLVLASVLLVTATGIPSIIHRCTMAYAAVCQPDVCCIEVDAEEQPCCTEKSTNAADDDCCVETVVVHSAHTTAVPTAPTELPKCPEAPAIVDAIVTPSVEHRSSTVYHPSDVSCIPYSPPDQAHLGVFLI